MDTNSVLLLVGAGGLLAEFFEILIQRRQISRLQDVNDVQFELNDRISEDRTKLAIENSAKESRIEELLSQIVVVVGQRDANLAALTMANDARHAGENRVKEVELFLKQVVERPAYAAFSAEQIAALIDHLSENINARIKVLMPATKTGLGLN